MLVFLLVIWYICWIIQTFLGYGTAYRYTKNGGDDGPSLFGWLIATQLAAIIPGLGYYMWKNSKEN